MSGKYPCHISSVYSGSATRSISLIPLSSKMQTSTFFAYAEKTAKFVPFPSHVAPRGYGSPSRIRSRRIAGAPLLPLVVSVLAGAKRVFLILVLISPGERVVLCCKRKAETYDGCGNEHLSPFDVVNLTE